MCDCLGAGPDNRGYEFIIGYMENIAKNYDVELFVTTMRTTVVTVNITIPKYDSSYFKTFTVTAGQVEQVFFSANVRLQGNEKSEKGILITADDEVVMYGVNKERYSNDAYLALPVDVLGQDYYAITYHPPSQQCELLVVAVEDSTSGNLCTMDQILFYY